jgi:hypothetical protein
MSFAEYISNIISFFVRIPLHVYTFKSENSIFIPNLSLIFQTYISPPDDSRALFAVYVSHAMQSSCKLLILGGACRYVKTKKGNKNFRKSEMQKTSNFRTSKCGQVMIMEHMKNKVKCKFGLTLGQRDRRLQFCHERSIIAQTTFIATTLK